MTRRAACDVTPLSDLELEALAVRHRAALNKLRDRSIDGLDLLVAVVAPSPRLLAASIEAVREHQRGAQLAFDIEDAA